MEASNSDANKCLLHDPNNKRQLMDAIRKGDVETAKQLIGKGIDINFILNDCTPLHAAMERESSMDMLELLLSQPNIDLNISNERLAPPLLWVLRGGCSKSSGDRVLRLIRAGCDINISDMDEITPLHYSVKYFNDPKTITRELLKRGADVNAQCFWYATALHCAVRKNDLELVCMLLYYNADVYIKDHDYTPLNCAVYLEYFEIAIVLIEYYDINYIIDVNGVCNIFEYGNAELFKAVWPRFNLEIILSMYPRFILNCLYWGSCSTSEWVKCLYLILNSDIAFHLTELINDDDDNNRLNVLDQFQRSMKYKRVQYENRVGLIYMALRLGFEVKINNINTAVMYYGLNQDFDPFIYGTYSSITDGSKFLCPLHAFVIGMETDYSVQKIFQLFHDALEEWNRQKDYSGIFQEHVIVETKIKTFAKVVAFFSFPADLKSSIVSLYNDCDYITTIEERLQEIPEFPSLTELSRNQIHK